MKYTLTINYFTIPMNATIEPIYFIINGYYRYLCMLNNIMLQEAEYMKINKILRLNSYSTKYRYLQNKNIQML